MFSAVSHMITIPAGNSSHLENGAWPKPMSLILHISTWESFFNLLRSCNKVVPSPKPQSKTVKGLALVKRFELS